MYYFILSFYFVWILIIDVIDFWFYITLRVFAFRFEMFASMRREPVRLIASRSRTSFCLLLFSLAIFTWYSASERDAHKSWWVIVLLPNVNAVAPKKDSLYHYIGSQLRPTRGLCLIYSTIIIVLRMEWIVLVAMGNSVIIVRCIVWCIILFLFYFLCLVVVF